MIWTGYHKIGEIEDYSHIARLDAVVICKSYLQFYVNSKSCDRGKISQLLGFNQKAKTQELMTSFFSSAEFKKRKIFKSVSAKNIRESYPYQKNPIKASG